MDPQFTTTRLVLFVKSNEKGSMKKSKRIGIMTSGGDCPGLNAVIRAVVKRSIGEFGFETIGIEDGFEGLIHNRHRKLDDVDVSGILTLGGTILGTSNRANPYQYLVKEGAQTVYQDMSGELKKNFKALKLDCLVCIGGDGTLSIAERLVKEGLPIVGVPKTIDNDVLGTDITFGFDTAVSIATEGVDRLHTTAQSHHRVMLLEVMGRRAGWIGLHAGLAGGGDIILIPEIPYDIATIVESIKERRKRGKRFTIMVVAEGSKPKSGQEVIKEKVNDPADPVRLGGISFVLGKEIEKLTGIETRNVVMGHLQRGGSPSAFDRILGTQLGSKAVDLFVGNDLGFMAAVQKDQIVKVPLSTVAQGQRIVPIDHPLVKTARSIGICFGS